MMKYTYRHFKALRTGAYTASLWSEGKRIATVEDDGRGGQPLLRPSNKEATSADRIALEAELDTWAKEGGVPDWYLTSFGEHARLTPGWELALGYLKQCAEYDRLAKNSRILRRADGNLWRTSLSTAHQEPGDLFWHEGDWIAALPAGVA